MEDMIKRLLKVNEVEEAAVPDVAKLLAQIDWKALESKLSEKLGVAITVTAKVKGNGYVSWESQELVQHAGIMQAGLAKLVVGSFGSSNVEELISKKEYWCTVSFSFELKDGGTNGIRLFSAWYDIVKKVWKFSGEKE